MNSFDGEVIVAYKAVCRCFQLTGQDVLQAFSEALCVADFLAADTGTAGHCATQVFSTFIKTYPPVFSLNPAKRIRGIFHLRDLVKVNKSFRSEEEKKKAYEQLCNRWFKANDVQGEGKNLWLDETLFITQPKGLLLLCDLFRCRIEDSLHFFMEEVALQMEQPVIDAPAFQFLLHCVAQRYSIKNN